MLKALLKRDFNTGVSREICVIYQDTNFDRTAPVAASDF